MEPTKNDIFRYFDSLPEARVAAEDGRIVYVSPAAAAIVGSVLGREISQVFSALPEEGESLPFSAGARTAEPLEITASGIGPLRVFQIARRSAGEEDPALMVVNEKLKSSLISLLSQVDELSRHVRETADIESVRGLADIDRRIHSVFRTVRNLDRVNGYEDLMFTPRIIDLSKLAGNIAAVAGLFTRGSGKTLALTGPDREAEFYGDGRLLEIMLLEMVTNAVKYSPEGCTVGIGLALTPANAVFRVTNPSLDTGGYEAAQIKYGIPAAIMDPRAGAGLGMKLVRLIASLHGGTVIFETLPDGAGVAVTASLPVRPAPDGTARSYAFEYCNPPSACLVELADIADLAVFENKDSF